MKYIVITSQVVSGGVRGEHAIEHYWDGESFTDRDQAISHGFSLGRSDDFNIGMVNKAGALHSMWWMAERIDESPETLREIGREVGLR